jgi:hypothetical protein
MQMSGIWLLDELLAFIQELTLDTRLLWTRPQCSSPSLQRSWSRFVETDNVWQGAGGGMMFAVIGCEGPWGCAERPPKSQLRGAHFDGHSNAVQPLLLLLLLLLLPILACCCREGGGVIFGCSPGIVESGTARRACLWNLYKLPVVITQAAWVRTGKKGKQMPICQHSSSLQNKAVVLSPAFTRREHAIEICTSCQPPTGYSYSGMLEIAILESNRLELIYNKHTRSDFDLMP